MALCGRVSYRDGNAEVRKGGGGGGGGGVWRRLGYKWGNRKLEGGGGAGREKNTITHTHREKV